MNQKRPSRTKACSGPGWLSRDKETKEKAIRGETEATMRLRQLHESRNLGPLGQELDRLRPAMAQAAQQVYDNWDQEDEFDEYGGGGICDAVAQAISSVICDLDCEMDEGGHEGDDHSYLVVSRGTERYVVDIPPYVYETGGGYSWKKIGGVVFSPRHIMIEPV